MVRIYRSYLRVAHCPALCYTKRMDKGINLLTPQQVAEMLGVNEPTLKQWRAAGTGPPSILLGRRTVRYNEAEVRGWIEEKRQ